MNRDVFIIGLWAACIALPNDVWAQWSFKVISITQTQTGFVCDLQYDVLKQTSPQIAAIPNSTKEACESSRQKVINHSNECVNIVCGPCSGPAGGNESGSSRGFGNADITGLNQGDPFQTANPFDAIEDAYEQKQFLNKAVLKKGEPVRYGGKEVRTSSAPNRTTTRDIPFDNARVALTWINGRAVADGKTFEWHGGRAGTLGGSNMRPAAPAARYNGQMGDGIFISSDGTMKAESSNNHVKVTINLPWGSASATSDLSLLTKEQREAARNWDKNKKTTIDKINTQRNKITEAYNKEVEEINKMQGTKEEKEKRFEELQNNVKKYDEADIKFKKIKDNKDCFDCPTVAKTLEKEGDDLLTILNPPVQKTEENKK
jgi:hypothetical protein